MSIEPVVRSLQGVGLPTIHEAFTAAFSDYAVPSDLPPEVFREFLVTRSFSASHSLGAFQGDRLVGFVLTGWRTDGGFSTGYDVATGVRAGMRKQGIGDRLLDALIGQMPGWGMRRFLLEVLETNEAALRLYENHGFRVRRRFRCLKREAGEGFLPDPDDRSPRPEDGEFLDRVDEAAYLGFEPAWQNALASYRNAPRRHRVEVWREDGQVAGYGIVHRDRGSLLQLGRAPGYPAQGPFEAWVNALASRTAQGSLSALNVEAGTPLEGLLEGAGFTTTVNQWEMVLDREA